jgi:hypothetical protein
MSSIRASFTRATDPAQRVFGPASLFVIPCIAISPKAQYMGMVPQIPSLAAPIKGIIDVALRCCMVKLSIYVSHHLEEKMLQKLIYF